MSEGETGEWICSAEYEVKWSEEWEEEKETWTLKKSGGCKVLKSEEGGDEGLPYEEEENREEERKGKEKDERRVKERMKRKKKGAQKEYRKARQ